MAASLLIARQLAVLLVPAVGFGCWLWLASGRPAPGRRQAWLWLLLAGFAAHALLLQSLAYAGLPLRLTAWPALALAGLGIAAAGWACWRSRPFLPHRTRSEMRLHAAVFAIGVAGQLPTIFLVGPGNYYGAATYDHANYVALGQFLVDERFDLPADEVGYRPWLLKPLAIRTERITQSVVLGAAAVASGGDCQETFGVVSVLMLALAGVATCGWLRSSGIPRWAAALAGIAVVFTPVVTRIHFDSFFSQAATLFVYPALAGLMTLRGRMRGETKVAATLLLAYLVGAYTELAIWGFAIVGLQALLAAGPWRRRIADAVVISFVALALNPGYFGSLVNFAANQWRIAGKGGILAPLFPDSGTLVGWGGMFFTGPGWLAIVVGVGIALGVTAISAWSLWRRRFALPLAIALAVGPLVLLRLRPEFPSYAFAKLCAHFVPIWWGGSIAALALVGLRWPRWRFVAMAATAAGVMACGLTSWSQHERIIHPAGRVGLLSSPGMHALQADVAAHAGRAYLMASDDPLLAQWLCFFARNSEVVLDRRTLGDRVVPTEGNTSRRWDGSRDALWWLDIERRGPVAGYEPPPLLTVEGASESGRTTVGPYHILTEGRIVLDRNAPRSASREVWLDVLLLPWGGGAAVTLEVADESGRRWTEQTAGPGWRRWPLTVIPGKNVLQLRVLPAAGAGPETRPAVMLRMMSVEVSDSLPVIDGVAAPFAGPPSAPR